jgi:uncharacterized protein YbbC (DUF1343 family)
MVIRKRPLPHSLTTSHVRGRMIAVSEVAGHHCFPLEAALLVQEVAGYYRHHYHYHCAVLVMGVLGLKW